MLIRQALRSVPMSGGRATRMNYAAQAPQMWVHHDGHRRILTTRLAHRVCCVTAEAAVFWVALHGLYQQAVRLPVARKAERNPVVYVKAQLRRLHPRADVVYVQPSGGAALSALPVIPLENSRTPVVVLRRRTPRLCGRLAHADSLAVKRTISTWTARGRRNPETCTTDTAMAVRFAGDGAAYAGTFYRAVVAAPALDGARFHEKCNPAYRACSAGTIPLRHPETRHRAVTPEPTSGVCPVWRELLAAVFTGAGRNGRGRILVGHSADSSHESVWAVPGALTRRPVSLFRRQFYQIGGAAC